MFNEKQYLDYLCACKYVESEISKINAIYQTDIYSDKIILPFSVSKFDKKLSNILTNTYALIGPETIDIFTEKYGKDILNICEYGFLMKKSLRHMVKSHAYVKNGDEKEPFFVYAIRTLGKDFKPFLGSITEDRCKYVDSEGNILAQIMLKSDVSQNSICLDVIKKYPEGVYHTNKNGEMFINTALKVFRQKDGNDGYRFANKVNKILPIVRVDNLTSNKTEGR